MQTSNAKPLDAKPLEMLNGATVAAQTYNKLSCVPFMIKTISSYVP
jgi:hypothetical protein